MAQVLTKPIDPYPEHSTPIIITIVSIVIIDVRILIIRIEVHHADMGTLHLLMKSIRFEVQSQPHLYFFSSIKS